MKANHPVVMMAACTGTFLLGLMFGQGIGRDQAMKEKQVQEATTTESTKTGSRWIGPDGRPRFADISHIQDPGVLRRELHPMLLEIADQADKGGREDAEIFLTTCEAILVSPAALSDQEAADAILGAVEDIFRWQDDAGLRIRAIQVRHAYQQAKSDFDRRSR